MRKAHGRLMRDRFLYKPSELCARKELGGKKLIIYFRENVVDCSEKSPKRDSAADCFSSSRSRGPGGTGVEQSMCVYAQGTGRRSGLKIPIDSLLPAREKINGGER